MGATEVEQGQGGRCPECGQALTRTARFCSECGARLAGEPEREARKTVTAVFADVVGSTPLQERIISHVSVLRDGLATCCVLARRCCGRSSGGAGHRPARRAAADRALAAGGRHGRNISTFRRRGAR